MTPEGRQGRFRLRLSSAAAGAPPYEAFSDDAAALRATAVRLSGEGGRVELAAWSDELNDWTPMERLGPA